MVEHEATPGQRTRGGERLRGRLCIDRGVCFALFAYDVGFSIDLDLAQRLIAQGAQRETLRHKRRVPKVLEFDPAPIRVSQPVEPIAVGRHCSAEHVDAVLYDFGAISIAYSIPLKGPLDELLVLSDELYENAPLLADSRRRVDALLATIATAVTQAHVPDLNEDYVIYQVAEWNVQGGVPMARPTRTIDLIDAYGETIARILRCEHRSLSSQEIEDALTCRIAYSVEDATVIDWNAALVIDREAEDVRIVLEFANVELLEMRVLDHHLDKALTESYDALSRRFWSRSRKGGAHADLRRVAQLQADNALLFEGVNNTLKLIGDQYLARLYRLASQRFHMAEWDESILRKLGTLESIYQKMSDRKSHRRMEVLEWIVIVLIALEIVLSLGGLGH